MVFLRYIKMGVSFCATKASWFLAGVSFCAALSGCTSAYKHLRATGGDPSCIQQFRPALGSAMYNTQVDVVGKHLSGILVMKQMPDSDTRIVFTSEMGLTFFDFAFSPRGDFKVYHIMDKMNKKAVIKTLRKDFELILLEHTAMAGAKVLTDGVNHYYGFPQEKGVNYYITDSACTHLIKAQKASSRKAIVEATLNHYQAGIPDSITIVHQLFHFTIILNRLYATP
jgi:hypothetical protein